MIKEHFIADLKTIDRTARFESTFLVQAKEIRSKKKSGDPYLVLRLADRTGVMDARMWDNVSAVAEVFKVSDFVEIRGRVQDYNGQAQIVIGKLAVVPRAQVDPGEFLPRTRRNIDKMFGEVLATIDGFTDQHLRRLMSDIFRDQEIARRYKQAPAASGMHHAWVGGLLEHVLSCLQLSQLLASHYSELDSDLLASGVLLHDFGKIFELSADHAIEYTDEGRLLGHIAMGSAWLERRCDEIEGFPPRLKTLLLHLVLSHHGKLEFGSPKQPLFPEALALHYIDDLDSRLEMMRAATGEIAGEQVWSAFHRGLESVVLDKGAFLRRGSEADTAQESGEQVVADTRPAPQQSPVSPPPEKPAAPAGTHDQPLVPPALHPEPSSGAGFVQAEHDETPAKPPPPDLFSVSGPAGENRE